MSGSYPNEKYDARKKTINVHLAFSTKPYAAKYSPFKFDTKRFSFSYMYEDA